MNDLAAGGHAEIQRAGAVVRMQEHPAPLISFGARLLLRWRLDLFEE